MMLVQGGHAAQVGPAAQGSPRPQNGPALPEPLAPLWLFDLDNTLHDASHGIFTQIHQRMLQTIQDMLNVDANEADRLRVHYWQRYGATLIGMVRHHQVCPHEFLHRSHDFPVAPYLCHERGLHQALGQLPGEKIILTNAPLRYASAVLRATGIQAHFSRIISIEAMQRAHFLRPKPSLALMQQLLAGLGVAAQRCYFIDDTPINLKSAAQLGMKTIHFAHPDTPGAPAHPGKPAYVHLKVKSIRQLCQRWPQLLGC